MLDWKILAIIFGIVSSLIIGYLEAPAVSALWGVSEQIADQTHNQQLQQNVRILHQTSDTTSSTSDGIDMARVVWGLVLFIGIPVAGFRIGYAFVMGK